MLKVSTVDIAAALNGRDSRRGLESRTLKPSSSFMGGVCSHAFIEAVRGICFLLRIEVFTRRQSLVRASLPIAPLVGPSVSSPSPYKSAYHGHLPPCTP